MIIKDKEILVTGCAGFIGAALVKKLLQLNAYVIGIDNINDYYSKDLKLSRLNEIKKQKNKSKGKWIFYDISLEDSKSLNLIHQKHDFEIVVHLAAQAGVRYSLINPKSYINANLVAFGNILEICKEKSIKNFVFASSSSVYGNHEIYPFDENQKVDYPVSLYAATKKSNELMAHSYSHLYKIPTTGLRFFTVYGPWGRPDMAPMIFAKAILEGNKIEIFNQGKMRRDFTYIDDVVEGIYKCCLKPAICSKNQNSFSSIAPFGIFNIGRGKPIELMKFIKTLEKYLGIESEKKFLSMQKGDVVETWANINRLEEWIGYKPKTSLDDGIKEFVSWYKDYYCY
tara:strand:- start:82 stop:1104 length:1023 start_codon:yes stop_codon:yes gene_type:complete